MRLLVPDGSGPVSSNSIQLTKKPDWHDCGIPWSHCWSADDSVLYEPDVTEQATWGITNELRVESIPDRGSVGGKPLQRDEQGTWAHGFNNHSQLYGGPDAPLPGPAYIPASKRFRGRPAVSYDTVYTDLQSMLTPTMDWADSDYYFNAPGGVTAPYFFAMIVRPVGVQGVLHAPWDCVGNVPDGLAGPTTQAASNQFNPPAGTSAWSNANWVFPPGTPAIKTVQSGHLASEDETVGILVRVAAGTNNSNIWVYWRNSRGRLVTNGGVPLGTLDPNPIREMYFGWLHKNYMSHAGIVDGTIDFFTFANFSAFANQVIPVATPLATES